MCFWRKRGAQGSPLKDKGTLKKWLDRLADALKRLAGKAAEALPDIVGSVVGAILVFFLFSFFFFSFKFSWKGRWICCSARMDFNCFCCRAH